MPFANVAFMEIKICYLQDRQTDRKKDRKREKEGTRLICEENEKKCFFKIGPEQLTM